MESKLISGYFTRSTITITSSESVKKAVEIIMSSDLRHLPVVDSDNIVIGMISDRDLLPLIKVFGEEAEALDKTEVQIIMTKDVQVISPDESLSSAADMMISGEFHALPVVENQKLIGIITSTDLLRAMVEFEGERHFRIENSILSVESEQDF